MPNSKNSEILSDVGNLTQDSSPQTTDQQKTSDINSTLNELRSELSEVVAPESSLEWTSLNPFRQWLQLFWVERGNYKITEKGYRELSALEQRQFQELTESASQKTKDTVKEYRTGLSKKEVESQVRSLIYEGRAKQLLENGLIQPKRSDWKDQNTRIEVLKKFLTIVNDIKLINLLDFNTNDLRGLISNYYQDSPYKALIEAGYGYSEEDIKTFSSRKEFPSEKIYPWELGMAPMSLWNNIEMRKASVEWLLIKIGKSPKDLQSDDFHPNDLGGLIVSHYQNSTYKALIEAGYAYSEEDIKTFSSRKEFPSEKIYPWELGTASHIFWSILEVRRAAVEWLLIKIGKSPQDLQSDDFHPNDLGGLIVSRYQNSTYKALIEAGYAYSEEDIKTFSATKKFPTEKIYPWELGRASHIFWSILEMRRAAVEWLLIKIGKSPQDLQKDDFNSNDLGGLIARHYQNSTYKALVEAGYAWSFEEIINQAQSKNFSLDKLYPWQMQTPPAYHDLISDGIVHQWHAWYKQQNKL